MQQVLSKAMAGDFDPSEYDAAMASAFGDDYYNVRLLEAPVCLPDCIWGILSSAHACRDYLLECCICSMLMVPAADSNKVSCLCAFAQAASAAWQADRTVWSMVA